MPSEPADSPTVLSGHGTNRSFYLPRLACEQYQGDAVIHWTLTIALRDSLSPQRGEGQGEG